MSNSNAPVDFLPPGISIFGGLPTRSPDLAPSIVFIVLYALLLGPAIWRMANKESRAVALLWRPVLFIFVRITTFIIRAVQATGTYTVGLFIAELVLEISGFNIICEPVVRLLEQHLHSSAHEARIPEPYLVQRVLRLMRMALLAALILGIYTGTLYSGASNSQAQVDKIDSFRYAVSGLNVGIIGTTILLALAMHKHFRMRTKGTALIVGIGLWLMGTSAYRLAAVVNVQPVLATKTKIYFYIFSAAFEFVATCLFFAFNIRTLIDVDYKDPNAKGGPIGQFISVFRRHGGQNGQQPHYSQSNVQHAGYGTREDYEK